MTLAELGTTKAAIATGSTVLVRDAVWLVTAVEQTQAGRLVRVHGLSELVRDSTAAFYDSLDDIVPLDPAAATVKQDDSPGFRCAKLWLEATIRKTPVPLAEPNLTVSTEMLVDTLAYQRSAVRQALDPANLRPRVLIADTVGLGKTVEIGMLLSELVRRGRGERILIVTPKHVLEQFQFEMWTRFALPFVRLDSVGIQRVRQKLPGTRNPFSLFKRAIISLDTLKQEKYRAHLAKHHWDAVVVDESHNVTGSTQNNALVRLLAPNTDALILASATPHNGKKESFAELVRLLEPTAVTPAGDVIEAEAERLIIRRHRNSPEVAREVGGQWAERLPPKNILIPASPAEDAIADELANVWLHPTNGPSPHSGENKGLFPWTLAKAFLSSPVALRESARDRIKRLQPAATEAEQREVEALRRLEHLGDQAIASSSAKYDMLLEVLRSIGVGPTKTERAVVFSERVPTLKWLQERLQQDLKMKPEQIAVLHGGLSDVDQQAVVESFKQASSKIRILVTGDIASEGVNLHSQCHELIHYDIPWSLIRLEQRNGRIDRYGQTHRPQITTLLLTPSDDRFSGDVRVLTRLIEREKVAHAALGDVASLMGKYDVGEEEKSVMAALAKGVNPDEIIPTVEESLEAPENSIAAMLARVGSAGVQASSTTTTAGRDASTGLFPSASAFLNAALQEVYATPSAAPGDGRSDGGVDWRTHEDHGTVGLTPPRDLRARLEVLPQTYLKERHVTKSLTLATTGARANALLLEARNDKNSPSLWPEAHYLGPLHPILDWASDRALARLGHNEVFGIRGQVDYATVLLVGTLTNGRGQVVASSYLTAEFLSPTSRPVVTPHESAKDAVSAIGVLGKLINAQQALDLDELTNLVRPAVQAGRSALDSIADAVAADVERRVRSWSERVDAWEVAAEGRTSADSKFRRATVENERRLALSMLPDQRLVRPLLIVVPEGN